MILLQISAAQAQHLHPRDSMAMVELRREFDVDEDCEGIYANNRYVTDADCAALAARMKSRELPRLKELHLVRLFSVLFNFPHVDLSSALFHRAAIALATTARGPLQTRCAQTAACRGCTLCV